MSSLSRPPRIVVITLLFFSLLACLSGCSKSTNVTVLKVGHALSTDHPIHNAIQFMGERVNTLSQGSMRVDVYPGATLGNERELMELLQIGSLAMTKVSTGPMESFVPEMKVFSLPYVFRNSDHFWQVLEGEIGQRLLLSGEYVHLRGLGYYDSGSRSFYTKEKSINTPDDLQGLKIRVQKSQTSMQMVRAFGGAATPISFGELYTALDQGVVDGAENNPPSFYTTRHYEVAKYYSLNEHTYVPDIMLISTYVWNKLTGQQQTWLQQAMNESIVYQRKLWAEATQFALQEVEKAGVIITRPDKTLFAEKISTLHEKMKGQPAYVLLQEIAAIKEGGE